MSYTGNVEVGGSADTRELDDLTITKVAVGPMNNNAYLLQCRITGELALIDAANDAGTLLNLIGENTLSKVITTHQHGDHWQALEAVVAATKAETLAGSADAPELPVSVDSPVNDGARVQVGSCEFEVISLIGHTPGSIALLYDDPDGRAHVFSGDSLFPGGVGKTWAPEDFETLMNDVENKIFDRLPDDTWIYPGHGADTTLGAERAGLPEWRERGW